MTMTSSHSFPLLRREVNVTLPLSTLKNGSLFGHVFLGPSGRSPLLASDRPYLSVSVVPLTRYTIPKDTTFNLLSGGSGEVALYANFEAQNFTTIVIHKVL